MFGGCLIKSWLSLLFLMEPEEAFGLNMRKENMNAI